MKCIIERMRAAGNFFRFCKYNMVKKYAYCSPISTKKYVFSPPFSSPFNHFFPNMLFGYIGKQKSIQPW